MKLGKNQFVKFLQLLNTHNVSQSYILVNSSAFLRKFWEYTKELHCVKKLRLLRRNKYKCILNYDYLRKKLFKNLQNLQVVENTKKTKKKSWGKIYSTKIKKMIQYNDVIKSNESLVEKQEKVQNIQKESECEVINDDDIIISQKILEIEDEVEMQSTNADNEKIVIEDEDVTKDQEVKKKSKEIRSNEENGKSINKNSDGDETEGIEEYDREEDEDDRDESMEFDYEDDKESNGNDKDGHGSSDDEDGVDEDDDDDGVDEDDDSDIAEGVVDHNENVEERLRAQLEILKSGKRTVTLLGDLKNSRKVSVCDEFSVVEIDDGNKQNDSKKSDTEENVESDSGISGGSSLKELPSLNESVSKELSKDNKGEAKIDSNENTIVKDNNDNTKTINHTQQSQIENNSGEKDDNDEIKNIRTENNESNNEDEIIDELLRNHDFLAEINDDTETRRGEETAIISSVDNNYIRPTYIDTFVKKVIGKRSLDGSVVCDEESQTNSTSIIHTLYSKITKNTNSDRKNDNTLSKKIEFRRTSSLKASTSKTDDGKAVGTKNCPNDKLKNTSESLKMNSAAFNGNNNSIEEHSSSSTEFNGFADTEFQIPNTPGMLPTPLVIKKPSTSSSSLGNSVTNSSVFISHDLDEFLRQNDLDNSAKNNIIKKSQNNSNEEELNKVRTTNTGSIDKHISRRKANNDDGLVYDKTKPPVVPVNPVDVSNMCNLNKPRTLAAKRQLLQKQQNSLRYLMLENENAVYYEIKKRSKTGQCNLDLIRSIQNNTEIPLTRDCWRALSWLNTPEGRFYYQILYVDEHDKKFTLFGSKGNHLNKFLKLHKSKMSKSNNMKICSKICNKLNIDYNNIKINNNTDQQNSHIEDQNKSKNETKLSPIKKKIKTSDNLDDIDEKISVINPRPGPLLTKCLNRSLEPNLGVTEIYEMPTIQLELYPKIDRPLDNCIKPYLKMILPSDNITREWAEFAVSTLQVPLLSETKIPNDDKNEICHTFNIPYQNNQKKLLVRRIYDRKEEIDENDLSDSHQNNYEFRKMIDENDDISIECGNILTEMFNSVALSLGSDSLIKDDPDIDYSNQCIKFENNNRASNKENESKICTDNPQSSAVLNNSNENDENDTKIKYVGRKKTTTASNRLVLELKRLNATVIDAKDLQPTNSPLYRKCMEEFCKLGCICSSISNEHNDILTHCENVECMFECVCKSGHVDLNSKSAITEEEALLLREKATAKLAKVEKEFCSTIVITNKQTYLINEPANERKRSRKVPQRWCDYIGNQKIDNLLNNNNRRALQKQIELENQYEAIIPISPNKILNEKQSSENELIRSLRHCHVEVDRLELNDVEPWCMVHCLYKCFCKGRSLSGKPYEIHKSNNLEIMLIDDDEQHEPQQQQQQKQNDHEYNKKWQSLKRRYSISKKQQQNEKDDDYYYEDEIDDEIDDREDNDDDDDDKEFHLPTSYYKKKVEGRGRGRPRKVQKIMETTDFNNTTSTSANVLNKTKEYQSKTLTLQSDKSAISNEYSHRTAGTLLDHEKKSISSYLELSSDQCMRFREIPTKVYSKINHRRAQKIRNEIKQYENQSVQLKLDTIIKNSSLYDPELTLYSNYNKRSLSTSSNNGNYNDKKRINLQQALMRSENIHRKTTQLIENNSSVSLSPFVNDDDDEESIRNSNLSKSIQSELQQQSSFMRNSPSLPSTLSSLQQQSPLPIISTVYSLNSNEMNTTNSVNPNKNNSQQSIINNENERNNYKKIIGTNNQESYQYDEQAELFVNKLYKFVIKKLNEHVTRAMHRICHIQRNNTKYLPEPVPFTLFTYQWNFILDAYNENLIYIWEIQITNDNDDSSIGGNNADSSTINNDRFFYAITLKNIMPIIENAISVINIKIIKNDNNLPLICKMIKYNVNNMKTKQLSVLLHGYHTYWKICGFLKATYDYLKYGGIFKPTPQSHPILTPKINKFYKILALHEILKVKQMQREKYRRLLQQRQQQQLRYQQQQQQKQQQNIESQQDIRKQLPSLPPQLWNRPPNFRKNNSKNKNIGFSNITPEIISSTLATSSSKLINQQQNAIELPSTIMRNSSLVPLSNQISDFSELRNIRIQNCPTNSNIQNQNTLIDQRNYNIGTFIQKVEGVSDVRSNLEICRVGQDDLDDVKVPIKTHDNHRWLVINVVRDFSFIYFTHLKRFLSIERILDAIQKSKINKIFLRFELPNNFNVFTTPTSKDYIDRIYFGPLPTTYDINNHNFPQLIFYYFHNKELILREEYEKLLSINRIKRTQGFFLDVRNDKILYNVDIKSMINNSNKNNNLKSQIIPIFATDSSSSSTTVGPSSFTTTETPQIINYNVDDDDDDCILIEENDLNTQINQVGNQISSQTQQQELLEKNQNNTMNSVLLSNKRKVVPTGSYPPVTITKKICSGLVHEKNSSPIQTEQTLPLPSQINEKVNKLINQGTVITAQKVMSPAQFENSLQQSAKVSSVEQLKPSIPSAETSIVTSPKIIQLNPMKLNKNTIPEQLDFKIVKNCNQPLNKPLKSNVVKTNPPYTTTSTFNSSISSSNNNKSNKAISNSLSNTISSTSLKLPQPCTNITSAAASLSSTPPSSTFLSPSLSILPQSSAKQQQTTKIRKCTGQIIDKPIFQRSAGNITVTANANLCTSTTLPAMTTLTPSKITPSMMTSSSSMKMNLCTPSASSLVFKKIKRSTPSKINRKSNVEDSTTVGEVKLSKLPTDELERLKHENFMIGHFILTKKDSDLQLYKFPTKKYNNCYLVKSPDNRILKLDRDDATANVHLTNYFKNVPGFPEELHSNSDLMWKFVPCERQKINRNELKLKQMSIPQKGNHDTGNQNRSICNADLMSSSSSSSVEIKSTKSNLVNNSKSIPKTNNGNTSFTIHSIADNSEVIVINDDDDE